MVLRHRRLRLQLRRDSQKARPPRRRPGAARTVGRANATNPIPVIIPCHRVIGADGKLTGFGGGLPMKKQLLRLEGIEVQEDFDFG